MTEIGRRFIAFISREDEGVGFCRKWPHHDFCFASFTPGLPDTVAINAHRPDDMVAAFRKLHAEKPFCGVLNRKEKCVIPAALLASALNLPELIRNPQLARDKYSMRLAMNVATPGPRCLLLQTRHDTEAVPRDFFPAVLKPRYGFNSRSVCLVNNHAELLSSYDIQRASYLSLMRQDGTSADFVVEELIEGSEHTIDSFVVDGTAIVHLLSDKRPMQGPWFVETGDNIPSALSADQQHQVQQCTSETIRSLGIQNGWTHTEVRVGLNGPVPIECAARMGGGYFEQLIRAAWGIDRMDWLIRLFSGAALPARVDAPRPVCGRRYVVYGPPRAYQLKNAQQLFATPGIQLIWPEKMEHIDRVLTGPPLEFSNTLFEYMAEGDSQVAALSVAERVLKQAAVSEEPL